MSTGTLWALCSSSALSLSSPKPKWPLRSLRPRRTSKLSHGSGRHPLRFLTTGRATGSIALSWVRRNVSYDVACGGGSRKPNMRYGKFKDDGNGKTQEYEPEHCLPRIQFLFIGSRLCSTLLSYLTSRFGPCVSLSSRPRPRPPNGSVARPGVSC
jgi:hypothetical protein